MSEQKKAEEFGITEDDVSEIRQDINKFRFELVDILSKNNFDIGKVRTGDGCYGGRRAKQMERRIMKVHLAEQKLSQNHLLFYIQCSLKTIAI